MKHPILRTIAAALSAAMLIPAAFPAAAEEETAPLSRTLSDYTGAGTVIAVIDAGFDTDHPVFGEDPAAPTLTKEKIASVLGAEYAGAYLSKKIPLALDYVGTGRAPTPDAALKGEDPDAVDTDVRGLSDRGTSAASLAAGSYTGEGDIQQEDGTVLHDGDYRGAAPDAQLLLMKAAADHSSTLRGDAAAQAIRDALRLGADVILVNLTETEITDTLKEALAYAVRRKIPVYTGAGDVSAAVRKAAEGLSASVTDRGTLSAAASLPGVIAVGAAADPYASALSFTAGEREIFYTDSSAEYLGKSFAEILAGRSLALTVIPGVGAEADYADTDARGKIAVVTRGEIPFAEKAQYAAEAGAVGMIVVNTESGTARMALEGTSIPAVMVDPEDGAWLTGEDAPAEIHISAARWQAADFSPRGLTSDFDAAVAYLVPGENLTAARRDGYGSVSGTWYAAARAAGWCAAAGEYLSRRGRSDTDAPRLLAAAASPLYEGGLPVSPRIAGAGLLTADAVFPETILSGEGNAAVTAAGAVDYNTVSVPLRITNTTNMPKRYVCTADFLTDETDENGILTGKSVRAEGLFTTVSVSGENLADGAAVAIAVAPGETEEVYLRLSVPYAARRLLSFHAPYGFCLDIFVTVTEQSTAPGLSGPTLGPSVTPTPLGESVTHAVTLLYGDLSLSPLSDLTVYEAGEPLLMATSLAAYSVTEGYSIPVGSPDPMSEGPYDEAYNIVNPRALKNGWLELRLTALRDVESITVRFLNAEGRLILERQAGGAQRFITAGGRAVIPLWDFTAPDEPEYTFPDGTYYCEIRLSAMDGDAVQYLGFAVTADSEKPEITHVTFQKTEEGRVKMTFTAADNAALRTASVYDLSRSYPGGTGISGHADITGAREAEMTFDITAYDGDGPLYVEITDYAGSSTVLRYTEADLRRLTGAAP